jgi:hypothetical protein
MLPPAARRGKSTYWHGITRSDAAGFLNLVRRAQIQLQLSGPNAIGRLILRFRDRL